MRYHDDRRSTAKSGDIVNYVDKAGRLMRAASQLSLRDDPAVTWMLLDRYTTQDYGQAVVYADALLRTGSPLGTQAKLILTKMAEADDSRLHLVALLSTNPPWRTRFLSSMLRSISNPKTPQLLFFGLDDTANPPTQLDTSNCIRFLIRQRLYRVAQYTWLHYLLDNQRARAALLFNGDFRFQVSGIAFD